MHLSVALAAIIFSCAAANKTRPDLNPALGTYQDDSVCFPFKQYLHQVYRNFKSDPYFGGEAKCVKADPTGPLRNSKLHATFEYGTSGKLKTKITVTSSPGYNVGNVLEIQPRGGSLQPFNFTIAYRDCAKCKIFRHSYNNNGNGCSYWVTDDALGEEHSCCEFVYDLLCGTSPKYLIYDESCK
uniref:Putative lipocalin-2 1 n=1 Tax=Amblyomma triste TaxID=251400 RepID=A0A023G979_AMBTT